MTIPQAIFLGLVEGITEFLPISSTAHLIVAQKIMGIAVNEFFTVVVQLGAIAGLVFAERIAIASIVHEFFDYLYPNKKTSQKSSLESTFTSLRAVQLAIATLPIVLVGFLVKDSIDRIHDNLQFIAFMSVAVGVLLLIAEHVAGKSQRQNVGTKEILIMGIFQVVSLIPGTSRSGITTAGGAFQKMSLPQALEYSFLLSIPALSLAGAYELLKTVAQPIEQAIMMPTLIGTIVAFVSAIIGIEWLRATVKKFGFTPFVLYRFAFAAYIFFFL